MIMLIPFIIKNRGPILLIAMFLILMIVLFIMMALGIFVMIIDSFDGGSSGSQTVPTSPEEAAPHQAPVGGARSM